MAESKQTGPNDPRLAAMDLKGLKKLRKRIDQTLHRQALSQIARLEKEANELRDLAGLKRRPPKRRETPAPRKS